MKKEEPGPGSYKLGSIFDKYATPFWNLIKFIILSKI